MSASPHVGLFLMVSAVRGLEHLPRVLPISEWWLMRCRNLGTLNDYQHSHDICSVLLVSVDGGVSSLSYMFRFKCGRWFARAEDDGSIERFLVRERIPRELKGTRNISALGQWPTS